jgi:hypothetical protein
MFVSLLESGEPWETFHHAPSRKRERVRFRVASAQVGRRVNRLVSQNPICPALLPKIFRFIRSVNQPYAPPVLTRSGAYRDRHGRGVWDAMDVSAQLTNAHHTDGEGVWS